MSGQAVIDSLEFARNGGELRGSVAVSGLARLHEYLHDRAGQIEYAASGALVGGKPRLRVEASGSLNLACQRCLGLLPYPVCVSRDFLLARNEEELGDLAEEENSVDGILADARLDVVALVEEEILLGLPISPRHGEGECRSPLETQADAGRKDAAFAALAALKKQN